MEEDGPWSVCLSARLHLISIEVMLVGPSQDCLPTQVPLTHDPLFFRLFLFFNMSIHGIPVCKACYYSFITRLFCCLFTCFIHLGSKYIYISPQG